MISVYVSKTDNVKGPALNKNAETNNENGQKIIPKEEEWPTLLYNWPVCNKNLMNPTVGDHGINCDNQLYITAAINKI